MFQTTWFMYLSAAVHCVLSYFPYVFVLRHGLFTSVKRRDWVMVSEHSADMANQYSNSLSIIFTIDNNQFME